MFDPLDGSSNIDAGVNIGTIFGVYKVVSIFLIMLLLRMRMFGSRIADFFSLVWVARERCGNIRCFAPRTGHGCSWLYHVSVSAC